MSVRERNRTKTTELKEVGSRIDSCLPLRGQHSAAVNSISGMYVREWNLTKTTDLKEVGYRIDTYAVSICQVEISFPDGYQRQL